MLADTKNFESNGLTRIDTRDELDVQWWSAKFSVLPQALCDMVAAHGPIP